MAGKTRQAGGRERHEEPEMPESKAITRLPKMWFSGDVMVYENQGPRKDIVVIGYRLEEIEPDYIVSVHTDRKNRFISSSNEPGHMRCAMQIEEYAHRKELKGLWYRQKVQKESIRVKLGMDGPDRTYTLDSKPNNPAGVRAAKVLEDLGVNRKMIKFNPKEFPPIVIA
ncbi:MAG: hypothetical protein PHG85_01025 [Candidatus Altiarchaeota archaeon]|nr:hypothetical protein [Candidatus Altiarchaeota archaeon]